MASLFATSLWRRTETWKRDGVTMHWLWTINLYYTESCFSLPQTLTTRGNGGIHFSYCAYCFVDFLPHSGPCLPVDVGGGKKLTHVHSGLGRGRGLHVSNHVIQTMFLGSIAAIIMMFTMFSMTWEKTKNCTEWQLHDIFEQLWVPHHLCKVFWCFYSL